ncbi:hypothetical protein GPX89_13780 [Nocardia sp. ET3-3]|uniref:Amphi-Trp domain-containing protein n=1 Tax=Nocardia terrae TaxID=2675851 RepID=A0A7K1UVD2_9NOCA|nr:amphi-Trp domain-containing protein [Nocardia terrae]MVU78310.1 hypothetical protein [Nocardia terrae]
MTHHKIYEAHRILDRVELADQLRALADELDAGGVITYGSDGDAGTLALPDKLRGALKITRSGPGDHIKIVARLRFPDPESGTGTPDTDGDPADADWEIDDPYA